jgi:hypothetical protein
MSSAQSITRPSLSSINNVRHQGGAPRHPAHVKPHHQDFHANAHGLENQQPNCGTASRRHHFRLPAQHREAFYPL